MAVDISNALKIGGWMRPEELQWLAEQASTRKLICEVGSWMGRSTRAMADNLPEGGVLYAVDTWKGTPGPNECAKFLEGKPEDWLFEQFRNNFPAEYFEGPRHRVRPYQNTSLAGADYLCKHYQNRFDMIFLDAAHDYDNVKADIQAWAPFLKPGGLLCGHDFGGSFPGVQKAVREIYPRAGKVGAGSIWASNL
jgi:SAM-dependent methyltransferase